MGVHTLTHPPTPTHTPTHTHPQERFLLDYTSLVLNFMFARGLCYVEPDSAPPLGCGLTATSVGVSRLNLTPRTSKCMTEEQVWLLICAVSSTELSELPSRWPLPCWTVPSEEVILLFILSGTEPFHPLSLLLGPPST